MTALDDLAAATPFHEADAALRARMLSRLADTDLAAALLAEPEGERIELRIFPLETGRVALACDSENRLADFLGGPVAYAAMPGRVLAGLLRAEGVGLLVNPGHPSQMLLDAGMLDWLTGALSAAPEPGEARLRLTAPAPATVAALAEPLAARLADLGGLITGAALAGVQGAAGLPGAAGQGDAAAAVAAHVLLVSGAEPARQPAIAKALAEALAFLPPQPGGVDISFSDLAPPTGALAFDLTPPAPAPKRPKGPPILR